MLLTRHLDHAGVIGLLLTSTALLGQNLAIEPLALPGLPPVRISEIVETSDHQLWFGGLGGLWLHDGRTLKEASLPETVDGPRRVRCLANDGADLLVGLHSGVGRVRSGSMQLEVLPALDGLQVLELSALPDGGLWLRTADGMASWRDGVLRREPPAGEGTHNDFVVGKTHIWSFDEHAIYARSLRPGAAKWQEVAKWRARDLTADGDGVLAIGPAGVVHLEFGHAAQWLVRGDHGQSVTRGGDLLWMRDGEHLTVGEPGSGLVREVSFFRGGDAVTDILVHRVYCDSSGLVWLGTRLGAMRVNLCPGIDNIIIADMEDRERPGAMLELQDGRLLIGTTQGRLIESHVDSATPWRQHSATWVRRGTITSLLQDPSGRVWVGTRVHGLWFSTPSGWQRVGSDEDLRGVRDLIWFDGKLWACTNQKVLRIDVDGGGAPEQMWAGEAASGLIEAIQSDTDGAVASIGEISQVIGRIHDIQSSIASAVEEQTATTNEIGRNIAEAAKGSGEIARAVTGVADAARDAASASASTMKAATDLSSLAANLQSLLNKTE